jgi:hypothetical protein
MDFTMLEQLEDVGTPVPGNYLASDVNEQPEAAPAFIIIGVT